MPTGDIKSLWADGNDGARWRVSLLLDDLAGMDLDGRVAHFRAGGLSRTQCAYLIEQFAGVARPVELGIRVGQLLGVGDASVGLRLCPSQVTR